VLAYSVAQRPVKSACAWRSARSRVKFWGLVLRQGMLLALIARRWVYGRLTRCPYGGWPPLWRGCERSAHYAGITFS